MTINAKEQTLSDEMEDAFSSVSKLSFLKNKREQEVFKLALQTAFAIEKKFIKRLGKIYYKKGILLKDAEGELLNCVFMDDVIGELREAVGDKLIW